MMQRSHTAAVQAALNRQPGVVLLGPRQVGKTTLAQDIADTHDAVYLDMERAADRQVLAEPDFFLDEQIGRLVVIDEVQRMPDLFTALRGQIDRRRRAGRPRRGPRRSGPRAPSAPRPLPRPAAGSTPATRPSSR